MGYGKNGGTNTRRRSLARFRENQTDDWHPAPYGWRPFESLRREIDRLFDDFGGGFWRSPFPRSFFDIAAFGRGEPGWTTAPLLT
jgi:hypothetical protein